MKKASGKTVCDALERALKGFKGDPNVIAVARDAGFLIPKGQPRGKRQGYQIFIKVIRFDEALLKKDKLTGGLLTNL